MTAHVASIAARMSLRPPQRESLALLARICELIGLFLRWRDDRQPADCRYDQLEVILRPSWRRFRRA